jgi:hypothetical protein
MATVCRCRMNQIRAAANFLLPFFESQYPHGHEDEQQIIDTLIFRLGYAEFLQFLLRHATHRGISVVQCLAQQINVLYFC